MRTGTLRFGGRPRCNGTLRRNGTRLLTTITSVFSWRKAPGPGRRNGILSRAFCVYGVVTRVRPTGLWPRNRPCWKPWLFWLRPMSCPVPPRPPHEMLGYRGTPFRGGISGKGRRDCSGTMAPMTNLIAFIRLIACRFLSGRVFGGWASGGATFTRFLPHTPSSNAPRSPPLVAGVVNNVGGTDGLERVVRPTPPGARNSRRRLIHAFTFDLESI